MTPLPLAPNRESPRSWPDFLSRVEVGGALPMRFVWIAPREEWDHGAVEVIMTVPCVSTGETIDIKTRRDLPGPFERCSFPADWIRNLVLWFYRHEAEEQLKIDGVRLFYPSHEH